MEQPIKEVDLFPDLGKEPIRNFTETGWGRVPIQLDDAGLHPFAFAVYFRISVMSDRREDIPSLSRLATLCCMTEKSVEESLKTLETRNMLVRDGDNWNLTDPESWR